MVKALKNKEIDVTYRGLTADEVVGHPGAQATSDGAPARREPRHRDQLPGLQPQGPDGREARRPQGDRPGRSTARRSSHNVYKGTAEPLYSMVPKGITGHTTAFFDDYGEPSEAKAQADPRAGRASPSRSR